VSRNVHNVNVYYCTYNCQSQVFFVSAIIYTSSLSVMLQGLFIYAPIFLSMSFPPPYPCSLLSFEKLSSFSSNAFVPPNPPTKHQFLMSTPPPKEFIQRTFCIRHSRRTRCFSTHTTLLNTLSVSNLISFADALGIGLVDGCFEGLCGCAC
jgi:hypothetical protein